MTFLALVRLMKVFTAYWLETAELPPGETRRKPCASSPSPPTTRGTRPVRALLRTEREIEHVTTPDAGDAAAIDRVFDIVLVDREIEPPGTDGLTLAQRTRHDGPADAGDRARHEADGAADEEAANAGIADFLLVPGLSADRLEHAIRYAITHQRTLQKLAESEERHALALRGANDGIWDWDVTSDTVFYSPRWKSMLGYREHEVG